ncbi:hypothetical protein AGMMS49957_16590 [Synergistales bacterium]|nr:hypothetical protein AGMMS49957_16590 [Synergistales bacterium]
MNMDKREQMIEKAMQLEDYDGLVVDVYRKHPDVAKERLEDELTAFAKTQDPRYLLSTMLQVAKAKGITNVGKATGLTRSAIYSTLADDGNPKLDTLLAILQALGYTFSFKRVLPDESVVDLDTKRQEEKLENIKALISDLESDLRSSVKRRQYA